MTIERYIDMKIVVLAAGTSSEREVSISSGKMVCKALRAKGHDAVLVDVFFGTDEKTVFGRKEYDVIKEAERLSGMTKLVAAEQKKRSSLFGPNVLELCREADIVFLALHGKNGEDGKLQAAFDLLGIPYTGSGSLGSALAMDKGLTKEIFTYYGIETPKGFHKEKGDGKSPESEGIGYPCVVKPSCGGSSVGVSIVSDRASFDKAVEACYVQDDEAVVEQYISGREFSIGVLDGMALPIIEIEPLEGFYDYENKYKPGATKDTCPAVLPDETARAMQDCAVRVFRALRLGAYARMDFLLQEDGSFFCLEANTLPGMTPTSLLPQEAAAIGMDFPTLCERLIALSQKIER